MTTTTKKRRRARAARGRAIGIARVSETRGQDGTSLPEQRDRIRDAAAREDLELLEVIDEPDVSGGTPLAERAGLRRAVEAVEAGQAQVIVAAFFDRLVRSLRVQDELVSRVEAAGGRVMAVDVGDVTNGSAGQWLSGTMLGAVSEYQRRTTAERTRGAQAAAIARGVAPWPGATAGYQRDADGRHVPDPATAPAVAKAFELRASGSSIREVREYLADRGVELTYSGTQRLLASRVVLGELHFGKHEPNLSAHERIVADDVWERAQRVRVPRGRRSRSERLLARLGVLRCGTCRSRMVADSATSGSVPTYRCHGGQKGDCDRPVSISAEKVEGIVTDTVRAAVANEEGRASAEAHVREAEGALDRAQADLDAAVAAFTAAGVADEQSGADRLRELREARDRARDQVERSGGSSAAITIRGSADWDRLNIPARRDLIRATVDRVIVAPGRDDRVTVELLGE